MVLTPLLFMITKVDSNKHTQRCIYRKTNFYKIIIRSMNSEIKIQDKLYEIAFFMHPALWLFLPEDLFREQAKTAILRYGLLFS